MPARRISDLFVTFDQIQLGLSRHEIWKFGSRSRTAFLNETTCDFSGDTNRFSGHLLWVDRAWWCSSKYCSNKGLYSNSAEITFEHRLGRNMYTSRRPKAKSRPHRILRTLQLHAKIVGKILLPYCEINYQITSGELAYPVDETEDQAIMMFLTEHFNGDPNAVASGLGEFFQFYLNYSPQTRSYQLKL